MRPLCGIILCLSFQFPAWAESLQTLHMEPAVNMTRADLHYVKPQPEPQAVLVLCPGINESGENLINSAKWRQFALKHNLGLVGLSFASPELENQKDSGYYYASQGSGDKLLEGIARIYGKDLPLLMYGFSGGAHFVSRFEEWRPKRVLSWCAFSALWWDKPQRNSHNPPGIVGCGERDFRLGASLIYFKQGRAAGKPWLWVCLSETGHSTTLQFDEFVRNYFSVVLSGEKNPSEWVDIDRKITIPATAAEIQPSLSAWLPAASLFEPWLQIHDP